MSLPTFPTLPLLALAIRKRAQHGSTITEEAAGGRKYRWSYWTATRRGYVLPVDALRDAVQIGGKGEVQRLLEFYDSVKGALLPFNFTDPWDSSTVVCHFVNDESEIERLASGYWSHRGIEIEEVFGES